MSSACQVLESPFDTGNPQTHHLVGSTRLILKTNAPAFPASSPRGWLGMLCTFACCLLVAAPLHAQRQMENLGRGIVVSRTADEHRLRQLALARA